MGTNDSVAAELELVTVGRVSMDLYGEQIGAPFAEIESFSNGVGGSPSNIAIGTSRLGVRAAAFTAVGDDLVGEYVLRQFQENGVNTDYIPVKPGTRTGLAILGVQPPDHFPLVFYRENAADIHLNIADARRLPLERVRAIQLTGTAFSRGDCRQAAFYIAERAAAGPAVVFHDLDLRPDQWTEMEAFGLMQRAAWPFFNVVVGTEEEFAAAFLPDVANIMAKEAATTAQKNALAALLPQLFERYPLLQAVILKRGAAGATLFTAAGAPLDIPSFPVTVLNTVGAGDAFASGLVYGRLQSWPWPEAIRFANACGAIVVTRHGCSQAMPYRNEVDAFMREHGE